MLFNTMFEIGKSTTSALVACLALVCLTNTWLIEAKPAIIPLQSEDPLLALPSQQQHENPHEPATVRYQQHEENHGQQYQTVRYLVRPETPEQYVSSNQGESQQHHQALVSHQNEASSDQPREYPGEIVYVTQNADSPQQVYQEPQGRSSSPEQELALIAEQVAQSAGMPATILTEVPLKDMPADGKFELRSVRKQINL